MLEVFPGQCGQKKGARGQGNWAKWPGKGQFSREGKTGALAGAAPSGLAERRGAGSPGRKVGILVRMSGNVPAVGRRRWVGSFGHSADRDEAGKGGEDDDEVDKVERGKEVHGNSLKSVCVLNGRYRKIDVDREE